MDGLNMLNSARKCVGVICYSCYYALVHNTSPPDKSVCT